MSDQYSNNPEIKINQKYLLECFVSNLKQAIFDSSLKQTENMTAKNVILTAIHFKGIDRVKNEAKELAENCLCSESYVKSIIKKIENKQIVITGA
jgi:DNA-binding MarR family transcriptional regulator